MSNLNDGKYQTSLECEGNLLYNGNTLTKCLSSNKELAGQYPYTCISNSQKGNGFCESVTLDTNNGKD